MTRPDWLRREGPGQYRIDKIDRYEAGGGPYPVTAWSCNNCGSLYHDEGEAGRCCTGADEAYERSDLFEAGYFDEEPA